MTVYGEEEAEGWTAGGQGVQGVRYQTRAGGSSVQQRQFILPAAACSVHEDCCDLTQQDQWLAYLEPPV